MVDVNNHILPDGMTLCWDSNGIYKVPTHKSQVRTKKMKFLWNKEESLAEKREKYTLGDAARFSR